MISFIIAHKNLLDTRKEVTEKFYEMMNNHLKNNYGLECLVADYGSEDGLEDFLQSYERITYIYTEPNPDQFLNIPKCYNHLTIKANGPIIAPLGPDFRFGADLVDNVINIFRLLGPIILRSECYKLNASGKMVDWTFSPYFIQKKNILIAGGWDERMYGWGKEEDDLIQRVYNYQRLLEVRVKGFGYEHIWHDDAFRKTYDHHGNRNYNIMMENIKTNGQNLVNTYWTRKVASSAPIKSSDPISTTEDQ